jgi:hypothetical protein
MSATTASQCRIDTAADVADVIALLRPTYDRPTG